MDKQKTVSIVMCTYNGEKYLRPQLNSILAQTYAATEIIVQDDCSTDSTPDILRYYAACFPQIKLTVNEHNLGFNRNFQSASMRATGQLIAIADQDDIWLPNKLERQVAAIGSASICYHDVTRGADIDRSVRVAYKPYMESLLFRSILGHTMLIDAHFLQHEARWDLSAYYDRSLALSALLYGRGLARVAEPLVWHREHEAEVSAMTGSPKPNAAKWEPYLKGWADYTAISRSRIWRTFYSTLLSEPAMGRYPEATKMIECMLHGGTISTLRLCFLCLKHRQKVYPTSISGLKGALRGFFYPAIFAYFNKHYFIE